ncbi:pilus assembly protein [Corticibacter populi]|uniref:Pilus assembly protein n=1 Tax=Corticibacter populi TaxID=1550736 RepID=A0A3M6QTG4_9BURK|nr:pilus assembly protein [Corticibacter populi]
MACQNPPPLRGTPSLSLPNLPQQGAGAASWPRAVRERAGGTRGGPARGRQRGVYALEWAIIFPVFFMLLYAIISYGLAFLVRESMQFAAEDGARAVLRYQSDRNARLDTARAVVISRLGWLPDALRPTTDTISVNICHVGNAASCAPSLTCGTTIAERCMVQLDFSIAYGSAPLVPGLSLLDMDILNPATLSASASILVDRGGF